MRTSSREIERTVAGRRRQWMIGTAGVVTALAIAGGVHALGAKDDAHGEIVRVIDGDTLVALIEGEETTIRLLNIDTPETKDPNQGTQCLGPEATRFLTQRLPAGTEIELEYDQDRSDRYDRILAGVYESDSLINAEIAAEGLGVPVLFEPNDRFFGEVEKASRAAQEAGLGLFSAEVSCSLPAQAQALSDDVDQVPSTIEGDPTNALADATALVEEIDVFVAALGPSGLPGLGNAVMAATSMESYLEEVITEAGDLREGAEAARVALDDAKADYDAEQERLQREEQERLEREAKEEEERRQREEQERLEREAQEEQERLDREETERQERESQKQVPGSSTSSGPKGSSSGNSGNSGNSEAETSSGGSRTPATKAPKPAPESEQEKPKSSSGCIPYGPEISYSDDGGYTGLRHGMPGGKTFRKCS